MARPLDEPALKTPPGVISQFPTTHSDEQAWFYVSATLSVVIPGILLLLRLYTKLRIVRKADMTDYLITLAFFFLIAIIICSRICLAEGAGVHQWNLPMHNFIKINYWFYVAEIIYAPTISLVKTAILLQYLRIFAPQKSVSPFMWYSARIIILATGTFYTISTFLTIFACSPREAFWNPLITNGKCLNNDLSTLITCLYNIVSDILILILPARAVWKLRINTKNKIKIVLLFAIGLLACIATGMIIVFLTRMGGENADVSYNTAWLGLWVFAEIGLGITAACTFLLPKFIEAEGTKLRGVFSSLTRPFSSLTRGGSSGIRTQSKGDTITSQELTTDTIKMLEPSESELASVSRDHDVERCPSF